MTTDSTAVLGDAELGLILETVQLPGSIAIRAFALLVDMRRLGELALEVHERLGPLCADVQALGIPWPSGLRTTSGDHVCDVVGEAWSDAAGVVEMLTLASRLVSLMHDCDCMRPDGELRESVRAAMVEVGEAANRLYPS